MINEKRSYHHDSIIYSIVNKFSVMINLLNFVGENEFQDFHRILVLRYFVSKYAELLQLLHLKHLKFVLVFNFVV